jgi:hypothetical protein
VVVFRGTPAFGGGRAVLFEAGDGGRLPAETLLSGLRVHLLSGDPEDPALEGALSRLMLSLYVDDSAAPRAGGRLLDLVRQGVRPVNVRRRRGEWVRVALEVVAPPGTAAPWPAGVELEVALGID